jgi:adenosyl cobinamide kinase/adenosyl cobinamide phosphate guanylyltransferase
MINKKDHPELYAAKLRRLDRTMKKLIAEHHQNRRNRQLDEIAEHIRQQTKAEKESRLRLIPDEIDT